MSLYQHLEVLMKHSYNHGDEKITLARMIHRQLNNRIQTTTVRCDNMFCQMWWYWQRPDSDIVHAKAMWQNSLTAASRSV